MPACPLRKDVIYKSPVFGELGTYALSKKTGITRSEWLILGNVLADFVSGCLA